MQVEIDITYMYTNFGGRRPSGFEIKLAYDPL